MTLYFKRTLLLLGLVTILGSCSTYFYYPTEQNVLRFKEKGDISASYSVDVGPFQHFNAGYSITPNIALSSSFRTFQLESQPNKKHKKLDDYLWENELTLYHKLPFNFYPAINIGQGFGEINMLNGGYDLRVNRLYIQPSIGYSNDFFDLAISSRVSKVSYSIKQLRELPCYLEFREHYKLQDVGLKDFIFLEPAVTVGVGYKSIKLRFQYLTAMEITGGRIPYIRGSMLLSLNLRLNVFKFRR